MDILELRRLARDVIDDPRLTYRQRMHNLAVLAENALEPPPVSDACAQALEKRLICDMYEGNAPHRPRYVLPDYATLLRDGSRFLELEPARDLDEALTTLLIGYSQVPSITGYPVWLGDLDALLEPYVGELDDDELHRRLRLFWISLDRMFPDAFTHANLGPRDGRVVRMALRLERELHQVVPNLSLKVDPDLTPDDLVRDAVETVFECGQPHFVNHPMMVAGLGPSYGVASCYNSLRTGGGSHTLVRLNLAEVANLHSGDRDSFLDVLLPHYVELTAELMEARIRHLVEEARFFEHSWLVTDGLLHLDRYSAMFGVYGLAEAVSRVLEHEGGSGRYGHDPEANALAEQILARVSELVATRPLPYCEGNHGRALLHSQSGIDSDVGVTAGCRVPVGEEPGLVEHLRTITPHHELFPAGISDVLAFDETARRNPAAVVDVVRGAFRTGMRDFTFNLDSNDFIRITGYLVRKSDLAKLDAPTPEGARHGSTFLGAGSVRESHVDQRVPKRVVAHELDAGPAR
ncbi:YjjI family glycine radical enzyme [Nocardioides sp.]|uniref:YjjI family glycine radical enzyme n=1 Tax=Nocardioides sp. TaxID=35761 RepID=UPI001A27702E|nr:YjjI family glycine radical enzyme [Nocardioides sp.]MBJ7357628.1 YjjI family glycine radical enzyme [Nocardioides sp.]